MSEPVFGGFAHWTPTVKRLADEIRELTVGEMLALKQALAEDIDLPPPAGVREPRRPKPSAGGSGLPPYDLLDRDGGD